MILEPSVDKLLGIIIVGATGTEKSILMKNKLTKADPIHISRSDVCLRNQLRTHQKDQQKR